MVQTAKLCSVLAILSLTGFGCGPKSVTQSSIKGHYENADPDQQVIHENAQVASPEYDPNRGVIVSTALLSDFNNVDLMKAVLETDVDRVWYMVPSSFAGSLASPEFQSLRTAVGDQLDRVSLVRQGAQGRLTVWARDWSPQGAKTADGQLKLLDFNYYPDRKADDATAQALSLSIGKTRVSVPVYNEGGNFMNNSNGHCLMTSRVVDANAWQEVDGDIVLDRDGITRYYKIFAGCKTVTIFPRMPYEGTGHIDMWAKFLDDSTLIVGDLRDETAKLASLSASARRKNLEIQSFLNERAADLEGAGYTVLRVPMPAPLFTQDGATFRSYTNSLTLNGSVIIPRYRAPTVSMGWGSSKYPDAAYLSSWESEVAQAYQSLGYRVRWVDSDKLIGAGGAVHCSTMQIPR